MAVHGDGLWRESLIGGHDVTLRAAIDHVTNRRYWMFRYSDYIAPGDPRTVSLNARIDF